jgi:glycosyltransferase involved in cell wall biosynthesis
LPSYGIGFAAWSITKGMNASDIEAYILSKKNESGAVTEYDLETVSNRYIYILLLKLSPKLLQKLIEFKFKRLIKKFDLVYFWPGCPIELIQYAKDLKKTVIIENINCHQSEAKKILDDESTKLGGIKTHSITKADIDGENIRLALADFVFSPSSLVTSSLIKAGVQHEKIINGSYGLTQSQQIFSSRKNISDKPFTALFVGRGIVRKGLHLLLEYWDEANIDGQLQIIGALSPEIETLTKKYTSDSVKFIPFSDDVTPYYHSADVFLLPSLEEGSPLVTYLALGAGLPCLVSPMAGDGLIRDGKDGYVIEPHDKINWVEKLRKLFKDRELRQEMALSAYERSDYFLWDRVAQRRADNLLDKLKD